MAHRLAPEARRDLDDIWHYVAVEGLSADSADAVINAIADRFLLLTQFPNLGRFRDADLKADLRSYPVGAYVIFYVIDAEDVIVLRVLHSRRDTDSIFDR